MAHEEKLIENVVNRLYEQVVFEHGMRLPSVLMPDITRLPQAPERVDLG